MQGNDGPSSIGIGAVMVTLLKDFDAGSGKKSSPRRLSFELKERSYLRKTQFECVRFTQGAKRARYSIESRKALTIWACS